MKKILEMFNQVKLNVLLLNAIQQVPDYAKFLKDMCTKKRKTNVPKKVFLATNIRNSVWSHSGEIQGSRMSHNFLHHRQTEISRALLDLGASINLLPLLVYQQLGLGELSPTRVTIQLVDRSVKVPKGKSQMSLSGSGISSTPLTSLCLRSNLCQIWVSNFGHLTEPIPCYSQCHNQL